jgi:hypothetical protein
MYALGRRHGAEAVIHGDDSGQHYLIYTGGDREGHCNQGVPENHPGAQVHSAYPTGTDHVKLTFDNSRLIPLKSLPGSQSSGDSAGEKKSMAKSELTDFRTRLSQRVELFKTELVALRNKELSKSLNGVKGVAGPDQGPGAVARGEAPLPQDKTVAIQSAQCPLCKLPDAPGGCACLADVGLPAGQPQPGSGIAELHSLQDAPCPCCQQPEPSCACLGAPMLAGGASAAAPTGAAGVEAAPCPLCGQPEASCTCMAKSLAKTGEAFEHLTHQLEGKGNVADPKALAAVIGRKTLGVKEMARRAAAGRKAKKSEGVHEQDLREEPEVTDKTLKPAGTESVARKSEPSPNNVVVNPPHPNTEKLALGGGKVKTPDATGKQADGLTGAGGLEKGAKEDRAAAVAELERQVDAGTDPASADLPPEKKKIFNPPALVAKPTEAPNRFKKAEVPMAKPPSGKGTSVAPEAVPTSKAELQKGPLDAAHLGAAEGMMAAHHRTAGDPKAVVAGAVAGALKGGAKAVFHAVKAKMSPATPVAKAELVKASLGTPKGDAMQAAHAQATAPVAPKAKMPSPAEHAARADSYADFTPPSKFGAAPAAKPAMPAIGAKPGFAKLKSHFGKSEKK